MIVKMKKITLIMQSKDMNSALESLRVLGLLHVEHENLPASESIARIKEERERVAEAVAILPDIKNQKASCPGECCIENEVLNLIDEKETLIERLHKIKHEIMMWGEWGDFDPGLIKGMENSGVMVRLCKIMPWEKINVLEGVVLEELFKKGNIIYCAAISREEIALPFETIALPEAGIREMSIEEKSCESRIDEIEKRLLEIAAYKKALEKRGEYLSSIIEFNEAAEGAGRFEKLSYVKGYCPESDIAVIEKAALKEKWGILISEPSEGDTPPTLIKNPRWVRIIEPMFKIINTIPGYREVDISLHFLIFFSIFFGMLIGDAGYGLVYFMLAAIGQARLKNMKDKAMFFLIYVLSGFAIIWGLMTGVFFGPQQWLKPIAPYFTDNTNVQAFCFLIGASQLTIAHIWKIMRKMPSLTALSDIGWICILWSAYFLAKSLILNFEFPGFMRWVFVAGSVLIVLFTNIGKNILAGIGAGFGDYLLKLVNSFADIVSYIRLFAVGLAGVAIAEAFNQIASNAAGSSFLGPIVAAFVLLAGHTLNLSMGVLSILVHGVRLNVLEFSGHLDMEWSGTKYSPFRVK